jgi:hypothetical protein
LKEKDGIIKLGILLDMIFLDLLETFGFLEKPYLVIGGGIAILFSISWNLY